MIHGIFHGTIIGNSCQSSMNKTYGFTRQDQYIRWKMPIEMNWWLFHIMDIYNGFGKLWWFFWDLDGKKQWYIYIYTVYGIPMLKLGIKPFKSEGECNQLFQKNREFTIQEWETMVIFFLETNRGKVYWENSGNFNIFLPWIETGESNHSKLGMSLFENSDKFTKTEHGDEQMM